MSAYLCIFHLKLIVKGSFLSRKRHLGFLLAALIEEGKLRGRLCRIRSLRSSLLCHKFFYRLELHVSNIEGNLDFSACLLEGLFRGLCYQIGQAELIIFRSLLSLFVNLAALLFP